MKGPAELGQDEGTVYFRALNAHAEPAVWEASRLLPERRPEFSDGPRRGFRKDEKAVSGLLSEPRLLSRTRHFRQLRSFCCQGRTPIPDYEPETNNPSDDRPAGHWALSSQRVEHHGVTTSNRSLSQVKTRRRLEAIRPAVPVVGQDRGQSA